MTTHLRGDQSGLGETGRAPRGRRWIQEAGLVLVILLLGLALTLASDRITLPNGRVVNNFLRIDNIVPSVLTPMFWLVIMAVGETMVIVAGGIDISVGSIYALATLVTIAVLQNMDENASAWRVVPLSLALALGVGLACGLINGALVVGLRMHPFIVTLATMSVFRGIAEVSVTDKSLPSQGRVVPAALTDNLMMYSRTIHLGPYTTDIQPVPSLLMLLVVAVAWVYLSATVGGREIYAVGGNEEAARFSGLPVGRIKLRVYALCGLLAGLAGWISAGFYGGTDTAAGNGFELTVIAAAVVGGASLTGGRGTALGALLGSLIIQLINNGIYVVKTVRIGSLVLSMSSEYSKIIVGCAIIVAVAVDNFSQRLYQRRSARARG